MWLVLVVALTFILETSQSAWQDPVKHNVQFVTVDKGAQLELLTGAALARRSSCSPDRGTRRTCTTASRRN